MIFTIDIYSLLRGKESQNILEFLKGLALKQKVVNNLLLQF